MTRIRQAAPDSLRVRRRALLATIPWLAALSRAGWAEMPPQADVQVDNFTFQPALVRVRAGTTVVWTNHDDIPHSIVVAALKVHSHPFDTNSTFSYRFEAPGTFNYVCGLHPHMKGQVLVSA
ncbi:MAG: cupredoxin family copper-binding protein [Acetobacteraceae bacterium]|nr:cupredoxin family copper-binding protein [Acetobacteraceae bacterium]